MAAAATTTSSSSLVVGGAQPKKLETESTAISKHELTNSCIESGYMGEISSNGNESQKHEETNGRSQPQKPIEFIDTTKKPHRIPSNDDCTMLPEGYFPKDEDVICSWARQNHSHPGNEKFRLMINKYAPTYLNANIKYQKSEVIAKIVAEVRSKSPGGGFVKKDFYSNRWYEVGDEKARDKVGHAIRKAAVELGKKLRGGKRQSQSLAKRRTKSNMGEFNQVKAIDIDMNTSNMLNKTTLMNGMALNNGLSGLPNDVNFSAMNVNMNMGARSNLPGRNPHTGIPNMDNASGIMNAMGMNGAGIGMNSITPGPYSRELEEMLMMNRLRTDLASSGAPSADSSLLGSLYGNRKSSSDSRGFSGLNAMIGMDDSAIMDQLQRRRLRMGAAATPEESMNNRMLRESGQISRWTDNNNNNNNNQSSSNLTMDPNINLSGLNGMNRSSNGKPNQQAISMGMIALGGAQGNHENINSNNFDAMSTNALLSKLAAGNPNFMQGTSNFGNKNGMGNSINLNNNQGAVNNSIGANFDQFSYSNNNGVGLQSRNQMNKQYDFNM